MEEKLQRIQEEAAKQIKESDSLEKLNEVRVAFLGKKGELTAVLKGMKDVAPEDRPKVGQWVNEARGKIEALLEERKKKLEAEALEQKLKEEVIDVTLPAKKMEAGHRHPNTIALEEVERIFIGMGYEVVEGEYPRRTSGKRRAGYLLYYQGHPSSYPDFTGTGQNYGKRKTAYPHDLTGTCVPF